MRSVLITGCAGGVGRQLCAAFAEAGWRVIGVDVLASPDKPVEGAHTVVTADIGAFTQDEAVLNAFGENVRAACEDAPLSALVNNAAVQRLGALDRLDAADIVETMNVNVIAPMLLSKLFLSDLKAAKGAILNIGSVHAQSTKPEFSAYATSKAALHGLTRALAVDLGPDVRVNALAPAAVGTEMLKDGFKGNPEGLKQLEAWHPAKRIAEPQEIAKLALFLVSPEAAFVTGSVFYADGGILSRLHDPV